jgi:hypothetical protein
LTGDTEYFSLASAVSPGQKKWVKARSNSKIALYLKNRPLPEYENNPQGGSKLLANTGSKLLAIDTYSVSLEH